MLKRLRLPIGVITMMLSISYPVLSQTTTARLSGVISDEVGESFPAPK